ncbi:MAG: prepilin peptidase [Candidatus Nealsonbacteria bacterium]|nr:prepilin peptidase [Candidatus Nealsonbacteria bacterium]
MQLFSLFIVFILGTMVGSFLNCVIYRIEKEESFLKGRSYCPHCKHSLSWPDLIPVLSFLILKRKCRYCEKLISWQYPLVEISTGIIFVLIFASQLPLMGSSGLFSNKIIFEEFLVFSSQNWLNLFYLIIISCFLIVVFVYDLKYLLIPDLIIYLAIGTTFLYRFLDIWKFNQLNFQMLINPLLSAFFASLFFLTLVLISKGKWMGIGDIYLAFLMGLILGWPNILLALMLAFFIGAIIGVGLIAGKKKNLKSEIPFGPFLVLGTFLAIFFGQNIIFWYLNLCLFCSFS